MATGDLPPDLLERIARVRNQRARRLLELIAEHGEVTTEELAEQYGYNHPPRAKKDATDLGFPIVSRPVMSKDRTRRIAAYRLDPSAAFVEGRGGRQAVPKAMRDELLRVADGRCAICGGSFADRALQVDHRTPYEVAGESEIPTLREFQMLCGSCNRTKSWTCETDCPNWTDRDPIVCATCLWASPEDYDHIATRQRRQVTITWEGEAAVASHARLRAAAAGAGMELGDYLRSLLDRG